MSKLKPCNKEERDSLESILELIRAEWGFAPSVGLSELVRRWKSFVAEVEKGYQLSIHDYTHDLAMRDLLERVKGQVPSRLAEEIEGEMSFWDAKYHQATRPGKRPIAEPVEEPTGEWWFRIPVQAGPEIQDYLLAQGLVGPD